MYIILFILSYLISIYYMFSYSIVLYFNTNYIYICMMIGPLNTQPCHVSHEPWGEQPRRTATTQLATRAGLR